MGENVELFVLKGPFILGKLGVELLKAFERCSNFSSLKQNYNEK